jgi:hypothetical protein
MWTLSKEEYPHVDWYQVIHDDEDMQTMALIKFDDKIQESAYWYKFYKKEKEKVLHHQLISFNFCCNRALKSSSWKRRSMMWSLSARLCWIRANWSSNS